MDREDREQKDVSPVDDALEQIKDVFEDYSEWFLENLEGPRDVNAINLVKLELMKQKVRTQLESIETGLTKALIARYIDEKGLLSSKKANSQRRG